MILKFHDYTKHRLEDDIRMYQNHFRFSQSNTYGENDELDAFRFAYTQGYISYFYGNKVAKKLTEDVIRMNQDYNNDSLNEVKMKLWNSKVGREVAKEIKTLTQNNDYSEQEIKHMIANSINKKMKDNKMITSLYDNKNLDDFDKIYNNNQKKEARITQTTKISNPKFSNPTPNINENLQNENITPENILQGHVEYQAKSKNNNSKTPCVGSYPVSSYTRTDGTEVSGYTRTCGAKHDGKTEKKKQPQKNHKSNTNQDKIDFNNTITGQISTSPIEETLRTPFLHLLNLQTSSKSKTKWENLQEYIYTHYMKYPLARNATINGLNNMSEARKDKNATVYESLNDLKDEQTRNKLKALGIPNSAKGICYNEESKTSQKIAQTKEIKEVIKNLKMGIKNENVTFHNNADTYFFLQHATVFDPVIKNNEFSCQVLDYSDFNKRIPNNINPKHLLSIIANNWGFNMQQKKYYQNFFIIIKVKIRLKN